MTAGVVLAAGAGRRFGSGIKQLALWDGEPLVRRACRTALDAGLSPVVVVLGANAGAIAGAVADLPVRLVRNERWADGMGTSVACGVSALDDAPASGVSVAPIDDVSLLLADQPLVTAGHLRALRELRRGAAAEVAATDTGEAIGVPAVFARSLFPALAALTGDRGARDLIARSARRVTLAFAPAAVDVDTPLSDRWSPR